MTTRDPTFQKFSAKEGKAYNASRGIQYPPKVFEEILRYHSGDTSLGIDLGCGPGNVTRDLTKYFDKVIGLDSSQGMIDAAKSFVPEELRTKLSFGVCRAEKLDQEAGLTEASVDVITCAVAVSTIQIVKWKSSGRETIS